MQPPRGSSITTSGRGADPRNIGDKQFMNTSIRILIDYLKQHEFNHAISPKILTRPAVKDFHNIVMFLFVQIDPNYKSTGKFEDEVVTMFKYLGYPYQISKWFTACMAIATGEHNVAN
jgi:kinetochore protein NDC80